MFSERPFSFLIAPIHPPTRAEEKDGACQNIGFLSPFQAMVMFCLSLFTLATSMLLQSSSGIKYHVRIVLSSRVENQPNFRDNSIFSIVVGIQEHPLTSCYIWDYNQEAGFCKQWVLCMKAGIDERQTWMLIHDKSRQANFSHYVVFLL